MALTFSCFARGLLTCEGSVHQAPGPDARPTTGLGVAYAGLPSGGQADRTGVGGPPDSVPGGGVGLSPQSSATIQGGLAALLRAQFPLVVCVSSRAATLLFWRLGVVIAFTQDVLLRLESIFSR